MKTYILEKEIIIGASLREVWQFFSDPRNLSKISPEYMDFRIVQCPETKEIYDGMLIEYRVSPLLKIPMKWVSLIKQVRPMQCFTDTQVAGPYALWEHTHSFRETKDGTHMHDNLKYALPMGPLGTLANALFVRRQLRHIFDYREQVIHRLFEIPYQASPAERP